MDTALQRLRAQQITGHDFKKPRDVVSWLCAVQAQDWAQTKWAVGVRVSGKTTDDAIAHAIDDGEIIRTHAMRWTWQLIAPEDVRWIIGLVGPELMRRAASRHRELGIEAKTILRTNTVLAKALRGVHLTRAEIVEVLEGARIKTEGQRLAHLLGCAELEGVICSGARRRKQATWATIDDRIPSSRSRDRDSALAELAWRYFQSRGPATENDFRWWSGLRAADVRAAIEANTHRLEVDRSFYVAQTWRTASNDDAYMLPAFDEILVGYTNRDDILDPKQTKKLNAGGGLLNPCIVHDGRVVGTWRRTLEGSKVVVTRTLFGKRSPARPIADATRRYLDFMG